MLSSHQCQEAILTDIHRGPIQAAQDNIVKAGLQEKAQALQMDGLGDLILLPDDTVVIAGLGGIEITAILSKRPIPEQTRLVLQPERIREPLRAWLAQKGYEIPEKIIADRGWLYTLFTPYYSGRCRELQLVESAIGEQWLQKEPNSMSREEILYLQHQQRYYQDKIRREAKYQVVLDRLRQLCPSEGNVL